MGGRLGGEAVVVAHFDVAQQEHPLPGHQDVVEEDQGIHLLEARPQRVVEGGAAQIEALPADEFQAGGIVGNGEGKCLPPGVLADQVSPGRVDCYLVGYGTQGGQYAAAPHDDAGVRLLDYGQRRLAVDVVHRPGVPAALQVHQGVGQGDVVFPDMFVEAEHVLVEPIPVGAEVGGGPRPARNGHVHEVGGPGHHAAAQPGPAGHHGPPALQVLVAAGDDKGQAHRHPRGRGSEGHLVPQIGVVLQVIEGRHRPDAAPQGRMGGDVLDPLAAEPDLGRPLPEPVDILLSRLGRHHNSQIKRR